MIEFGLGFLAALIAIQFYPRLAHIGAWIVERGKRFLNSDEPL